MFFNIALLIVNNCFIILYCLFIIDINIILTFLYLINNFTSIILIIFYWIMCFVSFFLFIFALYILVNNNNNNNVPILMLNISLSFMISFIIALCLIYKLEELSIEIFNDSDIVSNSLSRVPLITIIFLYNSCVVCAGAICVAVACTSSLHSKPVSCKKLINFGMLSTKFSAVFATYCLRTAMVIGPSARPWMNWST